MNKDKIENRMDDVYNDLVDRTSTPAHSRHGAETLTILLKLLEYLRGESDEYPLDEWEA